MARWNAVIRLPDFPDRRAAELYAAAEHSRNLIEVIAVASDEIAQEERRARARNQRLRIEDAEDNEC